MSISNDPVLGKMELSQMITLLTNPTAVVEAAEQLEARKKEVQALIDLVGPANEVLQIRKQIDTSLQEATQAVAEARINATAIVDDAKLQASKIIEEAKLKADAIVHGVDEDVGKAALVTAAAESKMREADEKAREVAAAEAACDKLTESLANWREKLAAREQDLATQGQELSSKLERLASVLKELG